ncbi:MAG: saccharopine dehydrogenase NADP-binding domain-containing protein [Gordonia sp. (in: high G+C Gram-positive bacteria)]
MTRILALGGAGEMGRVAAEALAASDQVETVIIGDRDLELATKAAKAIGGKAKAQQLDITDEVSLRRALDDVDMVVNTVGPYDQFGVIVLDAAIRAGVKYVDICDDPTPTLDMLKLGERAEAAGVTALIGMGASPGVSNLLAAEAASKLSRVDELITGWNLDSARPSSNRKGVSAAVVHGMRQISEPIPVVRDGDLKYVDPLENVAIDYPGIGSGVGRVFGHPEPVTLHRAFPELQRSSNVALVDGVTTAAMRGLSWGIGRGALSVRRAASVAQKLESLMPHHPLAAIGPGSLPPLFALAKGKSGDRGAVICTALAQVPGLSMARITGIPLAVGALMLIDVDKPGVHSPETLLEPEPFFEQFGPHCLGWVKGAPMSVTTSSLNDDDQNQRQLNSALLTALCSPANADDA